MNTSCQNEDTAGHWMVVIKLNENEIFIFDPLGKKNVSQIMNFDVFQNQLSKYEVTIYPYQLQSTSSSLCGWFSIICSKLLKDSPIELTPKSCVKLINELFPSKTPTNANAKILIKAFTLEK